MTKYDFDKETDRLGTQSVKWDSIGEGVLPMWVADMDFEVAPCIQRAVQERAAHPIYGYTYTPKEYYDAVTGWFSRRHNWQIDRSWILHTPGVVAAMSCAIKAMTLPGEKVIILTPVYNCFFSSIRNCGCEASESPLVRQADTYVIDYDDLERRCADERATTLLFCNPHNPAGRVWTREELLRVNEICLRHHVRVIADEIHCELVMPGHEFTPFAAVSAECQANSVTLNSPSKAFNTAGLQMSNVICSDEVLRRRIDRVINIFEVCEVNPFGPSALIAAYNEGEEWLDQLNQYLYDNYKALKAFFQEYMPKIEILRLEGTYLVWADCSALEFTSDELEDLLMREGKVYVNSGTLYGQRTGQGYLRINIACPRKRMMDGLTRMARVLAPYMEDNCDLGCPA